jgi:hypothetical protein
VLTSTTKFQLRNKYTLRAAIGLATTLPSALVSLVTVIYVHILNHNAPDLDTIQTWTCRYQAAQPVSQDIIMPANMGNGNFGALCRESVSVPLITSHVVGRKVHKAN